MDSRKNSKVPASGSQSSHERGTVTDEMRMRHETEDVAEARISIRSDGTMKFDRKALAAFAGRGIELVSFVDERLNNRATGRSLTAEERRALKNRSKLPAGARYEVTDFGAFLREIGIKVRTDRRYEARWHRRNSNHLIVRIK